MISFFSLAAVLIGGITIGIAWSFRHNKIRGQITSPETQQVLNRLLAVEYQLCRLTDEVTSMTEGNATLDQAVNDLDTAVTNKIAEDQTLAAAAEQGLHEADNVAKVEALVEKLNAETAAEKALTDEPEAPAAEEPAPVDVEPAPAVDNDAPETTQS